MNGELPEPWASELGDKGIHSYRGLGAATDVGHETARRLVLGGRTSVATVNKVADKLFGGDRNKVWRLHGVAVEDHGDWSLPAEASLLTERQRDAIKAVILAMTPAVAVAETPAPTEPPDDSTGAVKAVEKLRKAAERTRKKSPAPKRETG